MSDKKQNSVIWLFIQLFELFDQYERGKISRWTLGESMVTATEQAKAIHKEEVINAVVWFDDTDRRPNLIEKEAEEYYNETFGGQDNE